MSVLHITFTAKCKSATYNKDVETTDNEEEPARYLGKEITVMRQNLRTNSESCSTSNTRVNTVDVSAYNAWKTPRHPSP